MPENPQSDPLWGENRRSSENREGRLADSEQGTTCPFSQGGRFAGISRERWLELARHYAEIQQYQREHGLEDKGDPPPDNLPGLPPSR